MTLALRVDVAILHVLCSVFGFSFGIPLTSVLSQLGVAMSRLFSSGRV